MIFKGLGFGAGVLYASPRHRTMAMAQFRQLSRKLDEKAKEAQKKIK